MRKALKDITNVIQNEYRLLTTHELSVKYNKPEKYFRHWACKLGVAYDRSFQKERRKNAHLCQKCNNPVKSYKNKNVKLCQKCSSIRNINCVKRSNGKYTMFSEVEKQYLIHNYPQKSPKEIMIYLNLSWRQIRKQACRLRIMRNRKVTAIYNPATWTSINNPMNNVATRKAQSEKMKGMFLGKKNPSYGKVYYPKYKFSKELNHPIRSSWEEAVCKKFKDSNIRYEYEPETFTLLVDNKECTYTPDTKVGDIYYEIKGPIFDWQIVKMKKFTETHNLIIITRKKQFHKLESFKKIDYDEFISSSNNVKEVLQNVY